MPINSRHKSRYIISIGKYKVYATKGKTIVCVRRLPTLKHFLMFFCFVNQFINNPLYIMSSRIPFNKKVTVYAEERREYPGKV